MRSKINGQIEFDFQPSNLKLTNQYYAKYESISSILDENAQIVDALHRDLKEPLKYASVKGKDGRPHQFTSDQVLRILLSQTIEGASLREIVIRIDDSNFLRRFVRIYHGPMMDFTTLDKLKNSIRPKTWERVNTLLGQYAVEQKLISGEKLRLDTTAVETNIHWPTDSSLLWDLYRVLARLIEKAREVDPGLVGTKRLHPRRAKRLANKISRQANRKRKSARDLKSLYQELIERVEGVLAWGRSVGDGLQAKLRKRKHSLLQEAYIGALLDQMEHYLGLGERVIDQARRRVLQQESVPNSEKIFSIFEPHTELLRRGKAQKPIEFGHMIQIQQVGQKFITAYKAFHKKPVEHQLLSTALQNHKALFGDYPDEIGADKGYWEGKEALATLQKKVIVVGIGKMGKRTQAETERENDPAFRHAQRFRAGVEGTISFLKRVLRLLRCFNKGWERFAATIGVTVFCHNLLILSRG